MRFAPLALKRKLRVSLAWQRKWKHAIWVFLFYQNKYSLIKIGKPTSFELDEIASALNNRCSELCYREVFNVAHGSRGGFQELLSQGIGAVSGMYISVKDCGSSKLKATYNPNFLKIAPPGSVPLVRITTKSNVLLFLLSLLILINCFVIVPSCVWVCGCFCFYKNDQVALILEMFLQHCQ